MVTTLKDIVFHSTNDNDIVLNIDISGFHIIFLSLRTYPLIVLILNSFLDQSGPAHSCSCYSYTADWLFP